MAPIRRSATGDDAGFTLVEMLVVLAIIGLVFAATPAILRTVLPGIRTLAAARALAQDLRGLRGEAIAGGTRAAVRFDARSQSYEAGGRTHRLPGGVPFALPTATENIDFHADGSSSGGTVFVGEAGARHRVSVDWLTGRVTIDD